LKLNCWSTARRERLAIIINSGLAGIAASAALVQKNVASGGC